MHVLAEGNTREQVIIGCCNISVTHISTKKQREKRSERIDFYVQDKQYHYEFYKYSGQSVHI